MKYQENTTIINPKTVLKIVITVLLSLTINQVFAAFEIKKHTINSGGSQMTSASYTMNASIGQVDANTEQVSANYTLNSGFWHNRVTTPQTEVIFTNGFE